MNYLGVTWGRGGLLEEVSWGGELSIQGRGSSGNKNCGQEEYNHGEELQVA